MLDNILGSRGMEEKIGDCTIRIISEGGKYRGVVIRKAKMGAILDDDDLPRLQARLRNEAGKLHPSYIGMDGAIARFLSFFPGGFEDPLYVEDERSYKIKSVDKLGTILTLEEALDATADQAAAVRGAYVTNLLSPFELARTSAVLRGPTGAAFVQGAAAFTLGDYAAGLAAMGQAVAPHGRFSWPIATYLPNLWRPHEHMFLKPVATKDFAERIGHRFASDYDPGFNADVYLSLLSLVAETKAGLTSLNPDDQIDVQSFIWVVGDYGEAEERNLASRRAASAE
jgi:hypothetical protein